MNILIACERSQVVMKAFRDRGHNVYSCDTEPCYGGQPQYHIIADVLTVINGGWFVTEAGTLAHIKTWDMMIAHPPCQYLAYCGSYLYSTKHKQRAIDRAKHRTAAIEFFFRLYYSGIKKIGIENPRGYAQRIITATQIIEPWMFGDNAKKPTCLWLQNLPPLRPVFTKTALYRNRYKDGSFQEFTDKN